MILRIVQNVVSLAPHDERIVLTAIQILNIESGYSMSRAESAKVDSYNKQFENLYKIRNSLLFFQRRFGDEIKLALYFRLNLRIVVVFRSEYFNYQEAVEHVAVCLSDFYFISSSYEWSMDHQR